MVGEVGTVRRLAGRVARAAMVAKVDRGEARVVAAAAEAFSKTHRLSLRC